MTKPKTENECNQSKKESVRGMPTVGEHCKLAYAGGKVGQGALS